MKRHGNYDNRRGVLSIGIKSGADCAAKFAKLLTRKIRNGALRLPPLEFIPYLIRDEDKTNPPNATYKFGDS